MGRIAVFIRHPSMFEWLIRHRRSILHTINHKGESILHKLARRGNSKAVHIHITLQSGADMNLVFSTTGLTPVGISPELRADRTFGIFRNFAKEHNLPFQDDANLRNVRNDWRDLEYSAYERNSDDSGDEDQDEDQDGDNWDLI